MFVTLSFLVQMVCVPLTIFCSCELPVTTGRHFVEITLHILSAVAAGTLAHFGRKKFDSHLGKSLILASIALLVGSFSGGVRTLMIMLGQ